VKHNVQSRWGTEKGVEVTKLASTAKRIKIQGSTSEKLKKRGEIQRNCSGGEKESNSDRHIDPPESYFNEKPFLHYSHIIRPVI